MKTATSRSSVRAKNTLGTQNLNVSKIKAEDVDVIDTLTSNIALFNNCDTVRNLQIPFTNNLALNNKDEGRMIYSTNDNRLNICINNVWHYVQFTT